MAIKLISEFYNYSLYIFDLDNTIYKEEDYLFQAYETIAKEFAGKLPSYNPQDLFRIIKDIYEIHGSVKLFDKFLERINLDLSYLPICLNILRSFKPDNPIEIDEIIKPILFDLQSQKKMAFVLTNGNTEQQKNKIRNINWAGLDNYLQIVFANDIESKPSAAGVEHILNISNTGKKDAIFIGDSEVDQACAVNSGIDFINVKDLIKLL
jgi:phosphoglycolate phosphatase-like HAD superfamily hydrolase